MRWHPSSKPSSGPACRGMGGQGWEEEGLAKSWRWAWEAVAWEATAMLASDQGHLLGWVALGTHRL
jgi:hypothetical protein